MGLKGKFFDKNLMSIGEGATKLSVFSLALPIFFENVGVSLIGLIQTSLSSRFMDGFFVTPTGVANSTTSLLNTISSLVVTGMSILLSIYLGKKRDEDCKKIIGTAFIGYYLFRFLILGLGFALAVPLLKLQGMGTDGNISRLGYSVTYFRWQCVMMTAFSVTGVLVAVMRCYGYTKAGLVSSISSSLVTLVLTYIGLYVRKTPENEVIPVLLIVSASAYTVSLALVTALFIKRKIKFKLHFEPTWLLKIIKLGFPASISMVMYALSTLITASICVYLSEEMYMARLFVLHIVTFTNQLGYSVGQANSIMVGRGCGMGEFDFVNKMYYQNLRITLVSNFIFSSLASAAAPFLMRIFTDDSGIIGIGVALMWIDVAVEMGRGMNHLGQFGLNATGDTVYTTIVSIVSCWVMSVGIGYLLGVTLGLGVYGLWIASAADEIFRGVLYNVRWKNGRWKNRFLQEEKQLAIA